MNKYCGKCGAELKESQRPATRWDVWQNNLFGATGTLRSPRTGQVRTMLEIKCPNNRWWNTNHTWTLESIN